MTRISYAAKAAAIMMMANMVETFDQAVRIYDELANSHEPVQEVLARNRCMRWSAISDDLDDASWWEEVEMLAVGIDEAWDYFEFNRGEL